MIIPTTERLLRNSLSILLDQILPKLTNDSDRSAMRTITHLIRLSAVRIESEGQMLEDDIKSLKELLPAISAYFRLIGCDDAADRIFAALDQCGTAEGHYRTLTILATEAGILRSALYAAQKILIEKRAQLKEEAEYQNLRRRIRAYIKKQLEDETEIIDMAYVGHGPRR